MSSVRYRREAPVSKKILVVDKHPLILELISSFLGKDGHEVRVAQDGPCAFCSNETVKEINGAKHGHGGADDYLLKPMPMKI